MIDWFEKSIKKVSHLVGFLLLLPWTEFRIDYTGYAVLFGSNGLDRIVIYGRELLSVGPAQNRF
jgi:hypothetical protein